MENKKISPRNKVVDNLIEQIERDPGIWNATWKNIANQRPHNPLSGTVYRGVNMINLAIASNFVGGDPRWATYNQAKDADMPVKRGSKSVATAIFHKITTELITPDGKHHKINGDGNDEKLQKIKGIIKGIDPQFYPKIEKIKYLSGLTKVLDQTNSYKIDNKVLVTATPLFNFSQLENAPALEIKNQPAKTWQDLERAERLLNATGYKIVHDRLDQNSYSPATKEIHLVPKAGFESPEGYYSTAFHECAHAKMDERTIPLKFNIDEYFTDKNSMAKEELRAELSSVFICAELGINYDVQNHASYLNSWLKVLKEDKSELWNAAADSNKITDAIISLETQIDLEKQFQNTEIVHRTTTLSSYTVDIAGGEYYISPDMAINSINSEIVSNLVRQGYEAKIVEPKIYNDNGEPIINATPEEKEHYLLKIKSKLEENGFASLSKNDVQVFFGSKFPSEFTNYPCNDSELMNALRNDPGMSRETASDLITKNQDQINHRNIYSETALELAIREGNNNVVQLLIDNGADLNMLYAREEVTAEGFKPGYYTASHMAALEQNEEILTCLENAGADISVKDSNDVTARELLEAIIYMPEDEIECTGNEMQ